jgi:hypothetical protein
MAASVSTSTLQIGQKMPESAQLYRQAKTAPDWIFLFTALRPKNIPSEALLALTVYAIFG